MTETRANAAQSTARNSRPSGGTEGVLPPGLAVDELVLGVAGVAGRAPDGELVCAMGKGQVDGQSAFWDAFVPGNIGRLVRVKLATGRQFWATKADTPARLQGCPFGAVAPEGDQTTVRAHIQTESTISPARIQGTPSL